jgi:hypothetical protein
MIRQNQANRFGSRNQKSWANGENTNTNKENNNVSKVSKHRITPYTVNPANPKLTFLKRIFAITRTIKGLPEAGPSPHFNRKLTS